MEIKHKQLESELSIKEPSQDLQDQLKTLITQNSDLQQKVQSATTKIGELTIENSDLNQKIHTLTEAQKSTKDKDE